VRLVGFTVEIYYDARPCELQTCTPLLHTPWNSVHFVVFASSVSDTSVAEFCCHKAVGSTDIALLKVRNFDGFFDENCVTSS